MNMFCWYIHHVAQHAIKFILCIFSYSTKQYRISISYGKYRGKNIDIDIDYRILTSPITIVPPSKFVTYASTPRMHAIFGTKCSRGFPSFPRFFPVFQFSPPFLFRFFRRPRLNLLRLSFSHYLPAQTITKYNKIE